MASATYSALGHPHDFLSGAMCFASQASPLVRWDGDVQGVRLRVVQARRIFDYLFSSRVFGAQPLRGMQCVAASLRISHSCLAQALHWRRNGSCVDGIPGPPCIWVLRSALWVADLAARMVALLGQSMRFDDDAGGSGWRWS